MEARGVVEKSGRWYGLKAKLNVSGYELGLYMRSRAKLIAGELAKLPPVKAVILFGSVAQNNAHEYSDLDMIVVVGEPADEAKNEETSEISKLESKRHMTVEPLILPVEDFLENVRSHEGGIIYGVAEGFEVLFDETGELTKILQERVAEIRLNHDYLKEARVRLKVR